MCIHPVLVVTLVQFLGPGLLSLTTPLTVSLFGAGQKRRDSFIKVRAQLQVVVKSETMSFSSTEKTHHPQAHTTRSDGPMVKLTFDPADLAFSAGGATAAMMILHFIHVQVRIRNLLHPSCPTCLF